MEKIEIKKGHTNKRKYKEGNTFVLEKTHNGFNHNINYSLLEDFDFVPKLISNDKDKMVWEWIEGEYLTNPTDKDLIQLGGIIRTLHKSDVKFPSNNLRKRVRSYLKTITEKGIRITEVDNLYRDMVKLLSRMGRLNPCHNDIWQENIIKDKNGKLWLVDWEYATMGDKHYDLSFFIKSSKLDRRQEDVFLEAYNSHDDYQAFIDEWLPSYNTFVSWFTIIWAYAQPKMPFPLEWITKEMMKDSKEIKKY